MKHPEKHSAKFNKAVIENLCELDQWLYANSYVEDRVALFQDLWEVSRGTKAAKHPRYPAKPQVLEEARAYLEFIWEIDSISSVMVLLQLWRKHRRGSRYFSPLSVKDGASVSP